MALVAYSVNPQVKEVRLILIGKTGSGKSETGNTILGETQFDSSVAAYSKTKLSKQSQTCRFGRSLVVVDTPGFKDTDFADKKETGIMNTALTKLNLKQTVNQLELMKCTALVSPGPNAFIFVIQIGQRFGKEDREVMQEFQEFFGDQISKFTIVLFAGKDKMQRDPKIKTVEQFVNTMPDEAKDTIKQWGNRIIAFNNWGDENENANQVQELLKLVDGMADENESAFYTTAMFKEAEKAMQQKVSNMMAEEEKRINEETKKMKHTVHQKMKELENKEKMETEMRQKLRTEITNNDPGILKFLAETLGPYIKDFVKGTVTFFLDYLEK